MEKNVPSWATAMVRNWRSKATLPDSISDWEIYRVVKDEQISVLDNTEEEKVEILRECVGVE